LIDKMQVDNTTAFKIDRGFESKIGFGVVGTTPDRGSKTTAKAGV